jgi:hypothetical protein
MSLILNSIKWKLTQEEYEITMLIHCKTQLLVKMLLLMLTLEGNELLLNLQLRLEREIILMLLQHEMK